MIPIVRRLMLKGMPAYIAVVFILAGPVLNPVVYASTYLAFRGQPEMAYSRMGWRSRLRRRSASPLSAHPGQPAAPFGRRGRPRR